MATASCVTCRGDFDRHPSERPLPPERPRICEEFRRLPDVLERAAQLDRAAAIKGNQDRRSAS
jgi:hypothetical protein